MGIGVQDLRQYTRHARTNCVNLRRVLFEHRMAARHDSTVSQLGSQSKNQLPRLQQDNSESRFV